jgi:superfamily II DNA or RNA helicase
LQAPLITGKTPNHERETLYRDFREGRIKLLVVSKVANFAIDLPDANVAIQVSGTFGSRQEEAQRLGRILRPKADGGPAHFYTLVTRDTKDQDFSANRQLFLTEQGYRYTIMDAHDVVPDVEAKVAAEQRMLEQEGADALRARAAERRKALLNGSEDAEDEDGAPRNGRKAAAPTPVPADGTKKRRGRPPKVRPETVQAADPSAPATNGATPHATGNGTGAERGRGSLRLVK